MSFNFDKLRGKIIECYGTIEKFSLKLGVTSTTVGRKLSGKNGWTQDEIIKSCELLSIPINDIPAYFFYRVS